MELEKSQKNKKVKFKKLLNAPKQKIAIIITLIFLTIFLYSLYIFHLTKNKKENLVHKNNEKLQNLSIESKQKENQFKNDLECSKFKNDVVNKLENESTAEKNNILGQIFYSPTLNTCIYSYTSFYVDRKTQGLNKFPNIIAIEHTIIDQLTNETIFNAYSKVDGDKRASIDFNFYNKIEDLKKNIY